MRSYSCAVSLWSLIYNKKCCKISSFVKYMIRSHPVQYWYITSAYKHESGMQIELPRFPKFLSAPRSHYRNKKKNKKAHLSIQSVETHKCDNLSHPSITFGYLLSPKMQNRLFPENENSSDSSGIRTKGLKQVYGNGKEIFEVSICIPRSCSWVEDDKPALYVGLHVQEHDNDTTKGGEFQSWN